MTVTVNETNNEITVNTGVTAGFVQGLIQTKQGTLFIATPNNDTITLVAYSLFALTINQLFSLATVSGTIDLTFKINGVDVTGLTSITASSVSQDVVATANNVIAIGDKITLVLSGNSSSVDLEFTLKSTEIF